jgi:hypothetical protein
MVPCWIPGRLNNLEKMAAPAIDISFSIDVLNYKDSKRFAPFGEMI